MNTYYNISVILSLNNIISRNWGCSRNEKCAWKNISDISQTCKHNFPGDEEFSEPETRAVRVGILYFMIFIVFFLKEFLSERKGETMIFSSVHAAGMVTKKYLVNG